ncbi:MAG: enoyl-CoA hydratase/isomerase family protein [Actinomycetales bacterium]|nr:enoyl-CoA hydratase/isomerase family protein [Actinomycetales bacterium]
MADLNVGAEGELSLYITDTVATITLKRAAKLNTMTPAMGRRLRTLVEDINADSGIRCVVLAGEGDRAFSAGSDVSVLDQYGDTWQLRNRIDYAREIWAIRKPVIAKIRGYCIGGGLEMALMSDIRYCDDTARFGAGEIKLGWHGGAGNTQLLPRLIGSGPASEMLFTGDMVDAAEAARIGLVNRCLPADQLDAAVDELARRIALSAPIAAELAKHLVRVSQSTSLEVGLAYENDTFTFCMTTRDADEGKAAFAQKRAPHYEGK